MAKVKLMRDNGQEKVYGFMCPGCGRIHQFWVRSTTGPVWSFNGDNEKPMVHPSVKVTTRMPDRTEVCHSFITYGRIQFLDDCTHALKGQTVDLPDID